jgi:DNA polymerase-3 subunit delta'
MWNNIVGHKNQIEALKKTISSGKLPNAWLFAGPRGIGKRKVAQWLAAAVCCESHDAPCMNCDSCTKVLKNIHPDVVVVERETQQLKIEQVRELTQRVQFHALESKRKVAIIDDADSMTPSAANAILKLLEEPPESTHFVLVTAAAHRLLPTIRSRCHRISFSPLSDEDVASYLRANENWNDSDAVHAARLAQGSIGVAMDLTHEFIDGVLGRFEAVSSGASAADIISVSEAWAGDGEHAGATLDLLAGWFRDRLRSSVFDSRGSGDEKILLGQIDAIARARDVADTTANKQLMFEQLLFNICGTGDGKR